MENSKYTFILFVAGEEPNSNLAKKNLRRICQNDRLSDASVEFVDVLKDTSRALDNNILITPALLVVQPNPRFIIAGNLREKEVVLKALKIDPNEE